MNRTLLWVGLAVFAAGVAAGLVPLSSSGVSCGVAFAGSDEASRAALSGIGHDCDGVRSLVRALAVALIVAGGMLVVGALPRAPRVGVEERRAHRTVLGRPVGQRRQPDADES
ncbi:MAG TPA: hypothetical protein VIQ30_08320 [Pseudonocardia sp.]